MYGCESWTVKKAEHRRIDAFELWCWRRLLRVPWTARRTNQLGIPKENQPRIFIWRTDAEVEALILWLHNAKRRLTGKDPDAGKIEDNRKKGWQRIRWLDGITDSMTWVWVSSGSWWCYLTISSSSVPFSCWFQSLPASRSFLMSQLCIRWSKYWSFGASASMWVLPMNIQG